MSRYFTVLQGLRGCYMPDSCNVIRVDTRRELKDYLASEMRDIREAGYQGITARDVAWAAAKAWRGGAGILPYGNRETGRPYAVEVSPATRADWLESCDE